MFTNATWSQRGLAKYVASPQPPVDAGSCLRLPSVQPRTACAETLSVFRTDEGQSEAQGSDDYFMSSGDQARRPFNCPLLRASWHLFGRASRRQVAERLAPAAGVTLPSGLNSVRGARETLAVPTPSRPCDPEAHPSPQRACGRRPSATAVSPFLLWPQPLPRVPLCPRQVRFFAEPAALEQPGGAEALLHSHEAKCRVLNKASYAMGLAQIGKHKIRPPHAAR